MHILSFSLSITSSQEQQYFTRLSQPRQIAALICHWLSLVAYCLAQWFKVRLTDMSQLEPLRTGQLCCSNTEWWNRKKDRQEDHSRAKREIMENIQGSCELLFIYFSRSIRFMTLAYIYVIHSSLTLLRSSEIKSYFCTGHMNMLWERTQPGSVSSSVNWPPIFRVTQSLNIDLFFI